MKKNKKYYYYFLFFIIILLISILINKKRRESFSNLICIEKTKKSANNILKPIFRILFANYSLENECNNPILMISSFEEIPKQGIPYIWYDGESSIRNIEYYNKAINDPYCIGCFVTNLVNKHEKTYYLPLLLDRLQEQIINGNPITRLFNNNQRNKLAVYVAHYSPQHRDRFFKLLHSMDNTVEALGQANNTRKVDLPVEYLSLPEIYKDYKFVLAMENKNDYGYITEKIANAYISGAIPIYWGTEFVKEIFNIESFVYVNDYSSFEECAKDIIAISKDPTRYEKMRNAPIFNYKSEYEFWKYYDNNPSNYVINIANKLKERLQNLKRI